MPRLDGIDIYQSVEPRPCEALGGSLHRQPRHAILHGEGLVSGTSGAPFPDLAHLIGGQSVQWVCLTSPNPAVENGVRCVVSLAAPAKMSVVHAIWRASDQWSVTRENACRHRSCPPLKRQSVNADELALHCRNPMPRSATGERPENVIVCFDRCQPVELSFGSVYGPCRRGRFGHCRTSSGSGRGRGRTNVARPAHSTPKESRCLD